MSESCGGQCSCAGKSQSAPHAHSQSAAPAPFDATSIQAPGPEDVIAVANVNGVPLHGPGETLMPEALRQRACNELLRQAAQTAGLLSADDVATPDGVLSEAAVEAIDALLLREVVVPDPDEAAVRRYYDAHRNELAQGERVRARHILFAVTPGVDVAALRKRAESVLLDTRCRDAGDGGDDRFAAAARQFSNCPSSEEGGDLGWLVAPELAPEFARELFGKEEVGVLPRLVHSRFGLHVVDVQAREPGVVPSFEAARATAEAALHRQAFATAVRQYLMLLAGAARIEGVDLVGADSPLVQ